MDPAARARDTHERVALARRDPRAAEQALAALPIAAQVAVVCEAPLAERGRILGLMPQPEALIPELPPAELCFTIKAIGLADAAWVLEYATPEQTVAALDLDVWRGNELDLATANEWIQALASTSPEARVRALESLDAELLGRLDDKRGNPRTHPELVISAFVYHAKEPGELAINHEVQDAFWFPLNGLVDRARHVQYTAHGEFEFPGILVGEPDRHVVWGLTYSFLESFFVLHGSPLPDRWTEQMRSYAREIEK